MGFVADAVGGVFGGDDAADAAIDSANISAAAQREALEYLKEREAIPQQFREGALTQLGGLYGLDGGEGSQQFLIDQARASPYYTSMLNEGEDAVLRNAAMTGGFRSGNVQDELADNSQRVLADAYQQQLSGLTGLANLPSNANQIAQQTSGIGATYAAGNTAAEQARQDAFGLGVNTLLGVGGLIF